MRYASSLSVKFNIIIEKAELNKGLYFFTLQKERKFIIEESWYLIRQKGQYKMTDLLFPIALVKFFKYPSS